ncbi:hypothetical protein PCIT_b0336 [Pseudoalteromonas citrea]|uniref:Uncharacterized protein n=1 Tax=Pseudoalteromonas citrea TaxID=43655 RepID=A0AAD4FPU8_9GAMM|nr:hypothetical protein PCIT_b0336 [Pseudoalteromonas citrea]
MFKLDLTFAVYSTNGGMVHYINTLFLKSLLSFDWFML